MKGCNFTRLLHCTLRDVTYEIPRIVGCLVGGHVQRDMISNEKPHVL